MYLGLGSVTGKANFWIWCSGPAAIYIVERIIRIVRGNKETILIKVSFSVCVCVFKDVCVYGCVCALVLLLFTSSKELFELCMCVCLCENEVDLIKMCVIVCVSVPCFCERKFQIGNKETILIKMCLHRGFVSANVCVCVIMCFCLYVY